MKKILSNKYSYIIIAIGAVFCMLHSIFFEPIHDELVYLFVQDGEFGSFFSTRLTSIWDIFVSQWWAYLYHSGRYIVHFIVQLFAAILGRTWFSVCNGVIYFITGLMLFKYCTPTKTKYGVVLSSLIIVFLSYIFPGALLSLLATSLNYLWPLPLVLLFIIILKRIIKGETYSSHKEIIGLIFLGFFTGCTQEVYVFPLCVVTFFAFTIIAVKNKRMSLDMALLCISLWVGGAILGLAPGTLHRAGEVDSGVSFIANIKSGIYMLFEQVAFIALLIVLFCSIFISTIRKSLRENKIEFALLLVSIIFAILLHTTAQSFGGVQVFSFLILLSIINNILPNIKSSKAGYCFFECV